MTEDPEVDITASYHQNGALDYIQIRFPAPAYLKEITEDIIYCLVAAGRPSPNGSEPS
jgi:hypothetical protein